MGRLGFIPLALLGFAWPALALDTPDDVSALRSAAPEGLSVGAERSRDHRASRVRTQTVSRGGQTVTRVQAQRQGDRSRSRVDGPDRQTQHQSGRQQATRVFGSNGDVAFDHRAGAQQVRRGTVTDHANAGRIDRSVHGRVTSIAGSRSTVSNSRGASASRGEVSRSRVQLDGRPGSVQRTRETLTSSHSAQNRAGPPPRTPGQPLSRPGSIVGARPSAVQPGRPGGPLVTRPPVVGRPSAGPRPLTPARPGGSIASRPPTIGRPMPGRPVHVATRAPTVQVVRYRTVRPYHGVFVYGPRPVTHVHYTEAPPARGHRVAQADLPARKIDRDNSFALGLRMGSLISGYDEAAGYADLGFGGTLRFRPDEAVGLELAVTHFNQTFDASTERSQTLTAGSVELFAFPWARISPYVVGGVTWSSGGFNDQVWTNGGTETIALRRTAFGPHGGAGIEFALGEDVALDLEARYVGFLGHDPQDPTLGGGLTTTAGVLFHF